MNKLFLMGRLAADPEFNVSQSGVKTCKFRVAVDRNYTKQGEEKQADFLYIVSFGKTAEFVNKYFVKGKPILIEGRIQNNNYQDSSGQMQYHNQIIADNVRFTLSDPTRNTNGNQQTYQANNYQQNYQNGYNQPYAQPVQNQPYNQPLMQNYQQNQMNLNDYSEIISDDGMPF